MTSYSYYSGGQKFGILTFVSLSLKKKVKSKNLCLVKFGVLDYKNTQQYAASCSYQIHRSVQTGCGPTFARVLDNIPQSSLMATGQSLHVFVCWGLTSHLRTYHGGAYL